MDEKIVKDSQSLVNDTISRQAVIAALGERPMIWTGSDYELGARNQYDADVLAIETVPSAQPERKRGRWIPNIYPDVGNGYRCSQCGAYHVVSYKFCHNCGADMREVDDGSD